MSSPWTWQLPSTVRRGHGCLGGCRRLALGTPQLKRCKQCTEAASSVSKWTGQLGHGCTHHEASSKGVSHRRSSSYCTWPRSWPRCADVWNKAPPQLQAAHNYEQHSAPRLSFEARRGSVPPAELRVAAGGRENCTQTASRGYIGKRFDPAMTTTASELRIAGGTQTYARRERLGTPLGRVDSSYRRHPAP